jgi:hypothetical protein
MVTKTRRGWALAASAGVHLFLLGVIAGVAAFSPQGFKDVTHAPAGSQQTSHCGDESALDEDESTSDADLVMTITDCDEDDQRLSKR